jgi:uncharacterized protein YbjT (DUF2867 family)
MKQVIVAGGTGYLGRPLIEKLCADGFEVRSVARPQSVTKVPHGCGVIVGNVLDSRTYQDHVSAGSTFVHLVGVSHPAPWKTTGFRSVDLVSLEQSVAAAKQKSVRHFIFVSVAHPAPVMKAFVEVRIRCEEVLRTSGLCVTILRPWYILGPGHRWPYVLIPAYKAFEAIPATRKGAVRLGLVTRSEVISALAATVAGDAKGVRIIETAEIRWIGCGLSKIKQGLIRC